MRLFLSLSLLLSTTPAVAAVETLTLRSAIEKAKDFSPDMKTLRAQYGSAKAKSWAALAPAEPQFSMSFNDMPTAFHNGRAAAVQYQLVQSLGFPGKAAVNKNALRETAEGIEAQADAMGLQVSTNVKTAYLALAQAKENIRLNEAQRLAFERILEIAKRRYASGAISQVDLLNTQVQLYTNANDASDLAAAEVQALAQLNVLMGVPPEHEYKLEAFKLNRFPVPTWEGARDKMLANRNELRAARSTVSASEYAYTASKMALLPDFQLTATMTKYKEAATSPWQPVDDSITTTYGFGVQITIPIWGLFGERQGMIGAARDRAAARANLDVAVNQSLVTLKTTLETLRTTLFRVDNSEKHLIPLSEQALSLALINYGTGKIDYQVLADTANNRRNIRRDYFANIVNYITTYASLGQLLGEDL